MARRYLTFSEAQFALRRGRSVEVFLGECGEPGTEAIRYIVIDQEDDQIVARRYDHAIPPGSETYHIYSFGSLDRILQTVTSMRRSLSPLSMSV
jgi:hypothetical protein